MDKDDVEFMRRMAAMPGDVAVREMLARHAGEATRATAAAVTPRTVQPKPDDENLIDTGDRFQARRFDGTVGWYTRERKS